MCSIDERAMTMTIDTYDTLSWLDQRLEWNQTEWMCIDGTGIDNMPFITVDKNDYTQGSTKRMWCVVINYRKISERYIMFIYY